MMEIKEIDYGLSYHYGDYIEINRNLKKYPELYNYIMEHELKHSERRFSMNDLLFDIEESLKWTNLKKTLKIWGFMFRHPKSFFQFIPFGIKEKKLVVDINRIIVYGIFVSGFNIGVLSNSVITPPIKLNVPFTGATRSPL